MAVKRCVVCNRTTSHTVEVRFPSTVTTDRFAIPICEGSFGPVWSVNRAGHYQEYQPSDPASVSISPDLD